MRLNDPLITSFLFNEIEYRIDLAFDNVLDVFDVLEDTSLRDYEKVDVALSYLFDDQELPQAFGDKTELWNHVYKEYIAIADEKPILYDREGNPMPSPEEDDEDRQQNISVEQDAEYLFASFLQAYNINLYERQGRMHWLEFKALLNGLPSNTIMQRIVQIRAWKPSKGDTGKYKEEMRKLQKAYALKGTVSEEVE